MAKSMALNQAAGLQGMLKDGHKTFDGVQGAVLKNIEAARAIAGMMQTSMGPNGMNKLVINHLEKIIVSSDCATILKELEIQHPAANGAACSDRSLESRICTHPMSGPYPFNYVCMSAPIEARWIQQAGFEPLHE